MFTEGFSVSGTSLGLMRPGERGVVSRFKAVDAAIAQQLTEMGLAPGMPITVKQRFPECIVETEMNHFTLSEPMIRSIYVRLARH